MTRSRRTEALARAVARLPLPPCAAMLAAVRRERRFCGVRRGKVRYATDAEGAILAEQLEQHLFAGPPSAARATSRPAPRRPVLVEA
jgi:hypothetical protein